MAPERDLKEWVLLFWHWTNSNLNPEQHSVKEVYYLFSWSSHLELLWTAWISAWMGYLLAGHWLFHFFIMKNFYGLCMMTLEIASAYLQQLILIGLHLIWFWQVDYFLRFFHFTFVWGILSSSRTSCQLSSVRSRQRGCGGSYRLFVSIKVELLL